jgi:CRISPR-associated protein Csy1
VTRLDRARFETFVYYTNHWMADETRQIASASDTFRHLAGRPLAAMARQVIDDRLDVLVFPELGMHPDTLAFAAMRLAPVQCAAWGHPTTTGSPEVDWFISSEAMEPAGAQAQYSEKLALLPGLGTHYAAPAVSHRPTREEFGLPADRTLYLVPQSLFKIHPDNDTLIAEVLSRDERGIAVLFESSQAAVTQAFKARLGQVLAQSGLDLGTRVRFLPGNLQHHVYLGLNALCDVMLDTLHWSGGNTSLDAIASGLPIVTLPGELMRGRQSQAMLRIMGIEELVASDRAGFVDKSVSLGRDAALRHAISQRIAQSRGALFGRDEPIRALEAFLHRAVRG